jgi:hypothetical protein
MISFCNCLYELVQQDERARQLCEIVWAPAMPFNFDLLARVDLNSFISKDQ